MHGNSLVILLAIISLPILIGLVWVMFDDVREGQGHLLWSILKALACVFSLGAARYIIMNDEDDSFFNSIVVFVAYIFVIAGEYWLIATYRPGWITSPFSLL